MRTEDPEAWARWAIALVSAQVEDAVEGKANCWSQHAEIHSLNHVADVGPLTNNLIAMMVKDGVWPGPASNIAAQEE